MNFFKVSSVKEVMEKLNTVFVDFKLNTEIVDIDKSLNRILSQDIVSNINVPEFKRSTMDGYAINSFDSHGASESVPIILDNIGSINMGEHTKLSINNEHIRV